MWEAAQVGTLMVTGGYKKQFSVLVVSHDHISYISKKIVSGGGGGKKMFIETFGHNTHTFGRKGHILIDFRSSKILGAPWKFLDMALKIKIYFDRKVIEINKLLFMQVWRRRTLV